VNEAPWKKLGENIEQARSASQETLQGSSPDQDSSNWDSEVRRET